MPMRDLDKDITRALVSAAELLQWASRTSEQNACREACLLVIRKLLRVIETLGPTGASGVNAQRPFANALEEGPVSRSRQGGKSIDEVKDRLGVSGASEKIANNAAGAMHGEQRAKGGRTRYQTVAQRHRDERLWRLRTDLGLSSPQVAWLLGTMLVRPGRVLPNDRATRGRTPTKVVVTRLRQDLARLGLDDAVITMRGDRRRGVPGGYAFSRLRVAQLQSLLSFDLSDLADTSWEGP